jgi:hypothetical protein
MQEVGFEALRILFETPKCHSAVSLKVLGRSFVQQGQYCKRFFLIVFESSFDMNSSASSKNLVSKYFICTVLVKRYKETESF